MQGPHAMAPALLAKEPGLPGSVKRLGRAKHFGAGRAPVKLRKPTAKADSPKREVAERQRPVTGSFDLTRCEQNKPEHRLGNFMLGQDLLGNLAYNGQPGTELVVAL